MSFELPIEIEAEIKGEGATTMPPLDLDAIQARADSLDPCGATKADIYRLIAEVKRLRGDSVL